MEKDREQAKKYALEKIGDQINRVPVGYDEDGGCRSGAFVVPITSAAVVAKPLCDLHPLIRRFYLLGSDLVVTSLDVMFRKQLRLLMVGLNDEFIRAQMSHLQDKEAFKDGVEHLLDQVTKICIFVKNYDQPAHDFKALQIMTQTIEHIKRFTEKKEYQPEIQDINSDAIRRIHRHVGSYQREKILINDLDNPLYKNIEKLIGRLTSEAKGGRKNALVWSLLMSLTNQLQDVTRCIIHNNSTSQIFLTPSERLDLETNLNHLYQLSSILFESVSMVIGLDSDYLTIMESTSVLLVNTIFLLQQAVDGELLLWNPLPKYICNQRILRNRKEVSKLVKIFNNQIGFLVEIFTTCMPSSQEMQKNFEKLMMTCENFSAKSFAGIDEIPDLVGGHEDTWHNVICLLFVFTQDAILSLDLITENNFIDQRNMFCDLNVIRDDVERLANEMEDEICRMEDAATTDQSRDDKSTSFLIKQDASSTTDLSSRWINKLKSMRKLLVKRFEIHTSLSSPSRPPSSLSPSLPSPLVGGKRHGASSGVFYPFDCDCLFLLVLFCRAQVNKSQKFMSRRQDCLPIEPPPDDDLFQTFPALPLVVSEVKGQQSHENEVTTIIRSIIKECDIYPYKTETSFNSWVEQLNGEGKRLDELVPFLSLCSLDDRLVLDMKMSHRLLSSLIFQIDVTSRFKLLSSSQKGEGSNLNTMVDNLSHAARTLLEDVTNTAKEGFQPPSSPTEDQRRLLSAMGVWKAQLEF